MGHVEDMLQFAAIAQAGSISAAARGLRLPPSTLSRHLTALERALGVRLVERTTRSLRLTEAGEVYYRRCARIAEAVAEADGLVRSHGRNPRGTLRLSAPPLLGVRLLAEPLTKYAATYPAVRLEVELTERFVDVRKGLFDIVVRIGTAATEGSHLVRRVGQSATVLCASVEYLRRHGSPQAVPALRDHTLIALAEAGSSGIATWPLRDDERNRSPVIIEPRIRVNSLALIHELCRRGLGLAMLPRFVVGEDLRIGALTEVDLGQAITPSDVLFILRDASAKSPKVQACVDMLAKYVAERRPWM